ncbi:MAG: MCE family protein [Actinomycetota bacterium]|nr:MCE family protein [Actinomycetota bacterium]
MKIAKAKLLKVLAFSVVCIIFTVLLGVKLANSRLFADTYDLQAAFTDATGVVAGDAVKLAGVDVGRVTAAEIKDGVAIVTFNVDKSLQLAKDSVIGIRWRNVVGQRFLYVYPGDDDEQLAENDVIPTSQTEDVADIGEFLNRAGPILKAIDPEQANAFLDAMNTALEGNEGDVRNLIDQGAILAKELGANDQEIESLLVNADKIMNAFANQDDAIRQIIDDLDTVGGMLARRTNEVNSLVTDFAAVQSQLDTLLKRSSSNIDGTIDNLHVVANTLANNRDDLAKTLRTTPMGVAGYFQTSSWGEWFNVRIVRALVQDRHGNTVAEESEDRFGGPSSGAGGGGNATQTSGSSGGTGTQTSDSGGTSEGRSGEGLEAVLRFVLTGDEGA